MLGLQRTVGLGSTSVRYDLELPGISYFATRPVNFPTHPLRSQILPGCTLGLLRSGGLWHTCATRRRMTCKRCGQLACSSNLHQQHA